MPPCIASKQGNEKVTIRILALVIAFFANWGGVGRTSPYDGCASVAIT